MMIASGVVRRSSACLRIISSNSEVSLIVITIAL